MSNEVTNFKDWLKDDFCEGNIEQHAAAQEIWNNIPDNKQNYRMLDLRFATIHGGLLYDIFITLWNLYSEHLDMQRK